MLTEQNNKETKEKVSRKKVKDVEKVINTIPQQSEEVIDGDIDLTVTRKKRFRVNETAILELNTSDMNMLVRLKEVYPKLVELASKATSLKDATVGETLEEEITKTGELVESLDTEMRKLVDFIFDSNVSEVCAADGSMYDLFNGKFRFEHIIEKLGEKYGSNISSEFQAVRSRVQKHTDKYTGK